VESRSESAPLAVPVGERDHARGPVVASAEVTLVEYGDFECPNTRRARPVVRRLRQEFGDRLLFVFRNFPLTRIHPHAQAAAEATEAAGSQGRYWEMHDLLFENQGHLENEDLKRYTEQLGLDPERFDRELAQHARRVREDLRGGLKSGVERTPTFFVLTASGTKVPTTSRRCGPPWSKRRGERPFCAKIRGR
jgi:protein-disulfide isomerase